MRIAALFCLLAAVAAAQSGAPTAPPAPNAAADPAYLPLTAAFDALRLHDYDTAILNFRKASTLAPQRADIRKNLAYTLLKTGDNDIARDEFGEAMREDPSDFHTALEYAFLCFEAKDDASARKAEARRIFLMVSEKGDAESRATADAAFRNIDEPLRAGIERWQRALAASTPTFSAYDELAQLAEQRDETDLAAANYKAAFQLLPERRSVLLDLARVEKARGDTEDMMAALIAASRGPEPRTAELARERLPARYPYVYEFRAALALDPSNEALHRELAYLLLQMSEKGQTSRQDAENEFAALINMPRENAAPPDFVCVAQLGLLYLADGERNLAMPLLNRVLAQSDQATANRVRMALNLPLTLIERTPDSGAPELLATGPQAADLKAFDPRVLGERSYQAGFMKDALRYFTQAHEDNPLDSAIALKLGWTNNMLHDDATALRWFDVASLSPDPAIAAEAKRAAQNLRPEQRRLRTTVWIYPLLSSRWSDLLGYGQIKTELKVKGPLHPYASIRLDGDVRRTTGGPLPEGLSDSAFITALGVASNPWHGATAWFEAGIAIGYLNADRWSDYRGGVSYAHTLGAALGGERSGWFFETTDDSVFISHFDEDLINYSQNRAGYTAPLGGSRVQAFWNQNFTFDLKAQYWANFAETGPGFRIHPKGFPAPVWFNASAVHGVYLRNQGNPGRPNYNDLRLGIWYAFTK